MVFQKKCYLREDVFVFLWVFIFYFYKDRKKYCVDVLLFAFSKTAEASPNIKPDSVLVNPVLFDMC